MIILEDVISLRRVLFNLGPLHVIYLVDKVALGSVCLRTFQFSLSEL
jgi:hypothetical protein